MPLTGCNALCPDCSCITRHSYGARIRATRGAKSGSGRLVPKKRAFLSASKIRPSSPPAITTPQQIQPTCFQSAHSFLTPKPLIPPPKLKTRSHQPMPSMPSPRQSAASPAPNPGVVTGHSAESANDAGVHSARVPRPHPITKPVASHPPGRALETFAGSFRRGEVLKT